MNSKLDWRLGILQALANRLRLAPANVRAHYQRMLLDWTVLSLSKASAPPASLESLATKKRKLNSGSIPSLCPLLQIFMTDLHKITMIAL